MRKWWKLAAKHAARRAWSVDDVAADLYAAGRSDFKREVSAGLWIAVQRILQSTNQTSMFEENGAEAIRQLNSLSVNGSIDERLIGHAELALRHGQTGDTAVQDAVRNTIVERCGEAALQIEEHHDRKAKPSMALHVRERLRQAQRSEKFQTLCNSPLEPRRGKIQSSGKDSGRGLDDGPALIS